MGSSNETKSRGRPGKSERLNRKFMDRDIQRLAPADKAYTVSDNDRLSVRVLPSGRRSFITTYRWTDANGDKHQRWKTLGVYPAMSVAEAREKKEILLRQISRGIDPQAIQQTKEAERKKAPTLEQFFHDIYVPDWAEKNKRAASVAEDKRIFEVYIPDDLKKRKLKFIRDHEILDLLHKIARKGIEREKDGKIERIGGQVMANRTLALLRKTMNYAVERRKLKFSPCSHMPRPGGKETPKNRWLNDEELKIVWPKMDEYLTPQTCRAIKLILVTGQRPGEVASMHWDQIDGRWWTIPGHIAKNGREHRVFLSDLALQLMGDRRPGEFVFPARIAKKERDSRPPQPVNPNAFGHALRAKMAHFEIEPFTAHDLRRTAASHLGKLGHGLTAGRILNHAPRGVTDEVYMRYDFDAEKQKALESWSRKLEALAGQRTADKVVPLRANKGGTL